MYDAYLLLALILTLRSSSSRSSLNLNAWVLRKYDKTSISFKLLSLFLLLRRFLMRLQRCSSTPESLRGPFSNMSNTWLDIWEVILSTQIKLFNIHSFIHLSLNIFLFFLALLLQILYYFADLGKGIFQTSHSKFKIIESAFRNLRLIQNSIRSDVIFLIFLRNLYNFSGFVLFF